MIDIYKGKRKIASFLYKDKFDAQRYFNRLCGFKVVDFKESGGFIYITYKDLKMVDGK